MHMCYLKKTHTLLYLWFPSGLDINGFIRFIPCIYIYIYIYAHTHSSTKLWFSLVADMLTVKAKIPQKSHPVDCGDVAGCARGVTNLPIK